MANRRMFSMDVVGTDKFLDMPATSQNLYFHLGMRADDDGFVSAPKQITRMIGACDDDLKLLAVKGFIIPFISGVIVIKDWKVNNYLRRDRYTRTRHIEEQNMLEIVNDVYQLTDSGIPNGNQLADSGIPDGCQVSTDLATQDRLGKNSIDNIYIVEQSSTKYPYEEIIDYLNLRTGKNYKASGKATQRHINGRFSDGFCLEDFKRVIDHKAAEWKGTEFEKYLRPETLFGTKFEGYLNSCPAARTVVHTQEETEELVDYSQVERNW